MRCRPSCSASRWTRRGGPRDRLHQRNREATKAAYGLDALTTEKFDYTEMVSDAEVDGALPVIDRVPVLSTPT
ncbi:MAG: hypothetical protein R2704_02455 [Microthrixaceae bacterium]